MLLNHESCYEALVTHDARFDGVLFVGVTTTGVYCRPVCPARTPRRANCRFFANAAAAEGAGFRPCLRCRPELAPGNALVDAAPRVAAAVAARIEAGALNDEDVETLAAEFALSARQLRRLVKRELGVTPIELAQTQRLLLAKRLLTDSPLPVIEVAFASGFASVRQFNAQFRTRYGLSPTDLRRKREAEPPREALELELAYRPPYNWELLLRYLAGRATPGVETVQGNRYLRTIALGQHRGWLAVEPAATAHALRVRLSLSLAPALTPLLARLRNVFDLNAQPQAIETHLAADPLLQPIVARQTGLRLPGACDGFELAVRAVLGQQVSVRAATTLAGRVAAALGEPVVTPLSELNRLAVTPERVAEADVTELTQLGVTRARAECLRALAQAVAAGGLSLQPGGVVAATIEQLQELPGIGAWTAHYIAMRALRWPDAFPHADLGLLKALQLNSPKQVLQVAERWRPWRAYAAIHLWNSLD